MLPLVWLVPTLPLLGVVVNGIFGRWTRAHAHILGVGTTGLSFLIAFGIFLQAAGGATLNWDVYAWIPVGEFQATVGFLVDPLSAVMMLVVTFVGLLIHIYSIGYMHGDPGYARFFTYMNLFMTSMLILVLANNYLLMFLGWEGVGLCSYLLIGFWYQKKSAADAGKKAFVVNRIGDAGFLLGLFLIWRTFGSVAYAEIFPRAEAIREVLERDSVFGLSLVTWMTILLFIGATGKSAQLPLYVWLPDAMEGPTPVSALIHAATMVTAGVYMVARSNALFSLAPISMNLVATVGALTAVFAASIALVQNDIKRVVAYSTISQLGYMFLGCGVGAYASGVFHLATHAFFKALLFLGCGSVIHGLSGEQDIRKMGGLRRDMPITAVTFLLAALANAGIAPLAGFWSKDQILHAAIASGHTWLWALGAAGAFGTAFYMFRLYFVVFEGSVPGGPPRGPPRPRIPPGDGGPPDGPGNLDRGGGTLRLFARAQPVLPLRGAGLQRGDAGTDTRPSSCSWRDRRWPSPSPDRAGLSDGPWPSGNGGSAGGPVPRALHPPPQQILGGRVVQRRLRGLREATVRPPVDRGCQGGGRGREWDGLAHGGAEPSLGEVRFPRRGWAGECHRRPNPGRQRGVPSHSDRRSSELSPGHGHGDFRHRVLVLLLLAGAASTAQGAAL